MKIDHRNKPIGGQRISLDTDALNVLTNDKIEQRPRNNKNLMGSLELKSYDKLRTQ